MFGRIGTRCKRAPAGIDMDGITDEIAELINEQVDNLPYNSKVSKWYNRSTRIASNNTKFALARKFEDANSALIKSNSNPPCGNWGGNSGKETLSQLQVVANNGNKRVILDDAIVDPNPLALVCNECNRANINN